MRPMRRRLLAVLVPVTIAFVASAAAAQAPATPQDKPKPEATEVWEPVPKIVTPGPDVLEPPPSDAIVLFDGKNLDEWVNVKDQSPATWLVQDGVMTVHKPSGNIGTKRTFTNYQLHLEYRVPAGTTGAGQARGNSGLFLASTGNGDAGYELQILDSFENKTYVNGQAASIYKQGAPLANAMRKPGEWNVYDVIWSAPVFAADGTVTSPARVTVLHNGVLVQNHFEVKGGTVYIGPPSYTPHGPSGIKLQSHGDPSPPISFRNIWIRELP
jgi:3-keto-disaccharide hydrolase